MDLLNELPLTAIVAAPCVVLVLVAFLVLSIRKRMKIKDLEGKAVFISGCDSGFGHDLALKCARYGMPVFAGCMTEQGSRSLKDKAKEFDGIIETTILNVTSDESVASLASWLEKATEKYGGLHAIVNNAGVVGNSFYDEILSVDDYKSTLEVNTFGVIRVTHALRHLVKQARGRIVIAASICGRIAIPGVGPYTVSKFAVEGYSDIIRRELQMWGVSVHILEPGFFKTPLINKTTVEAHISKVWEKANPRVKEEYGEEFFRKGQAKSTQMLGMIGSKNLAWPVNAYFHAITARYPDKRYYVGYDCVLGFVPLSLLPTPMQDFLVNIGQKALGAPVPETLRKRRKGQEHIV